jgi:hypothetical protein
MQCRYPFIIITAILTQLVTGCGAGTEPNSYNSPETETTVDSEVADNTPTGTNNPVETPTDEPLELADISPEYNGEILENTLISAGNGRYWAGLWATEPYEGDENSLHSAVEIDGAWQTPITLTNGYLSGTIKASEDQIMVVWHERLTGTDNTSTYQIKTRNFSGNQWHATTIIDSFTDYSNAEIALTAMPGNRFALVWETEDNEGTSIRHISEWDSEAWNTPKTVPSGDGEIYNNQLVSSANGSLTYFFSRTVVNDDGTIPAYWSQDRIAGVWQSPVRLDDVAFPLWLTRKSLWRRLVYTNDSDRQFAAWTVGLADTFGTLYYGFATAQRDGPDQPWTSHFELTGTDLIKDFQIALADDGRAAITWLRRQGTNNYDLMLLRYTPATGWLPLQEDILQPALFPGLPPEPATNYPNTDRMTITTTGQGIRLSMVVEVANLEARWFYYSLQSGEIGFDNNPIINTLEHSRTIPTELLSCDSHGERVRCSGRRLRFNRFGGTPATLVTERIQLISLTD